MFVSLLSIIKKVTELFSAMLFPVCRKYSSSLLYRPSIISGHLKSWLSFQSFSSDGQKDGGLDDKKGVRRWESRDPLASKRGLKSD
jgi:hypothetical protein